MLNTCLLQLHKTLRGDWRDCSTVNAFLEDLGLIPGTHMTANHCNSSSIWSDVLLSTHADKTPMHTKLKI